MQPLSIDFGIVEVGTDAVAEVVATNIGGEDGVISVYGSDLEASAFSVSPTHATIAPDDSTVFEIRFAPDAAGAFEWHFTYEAPPAVGHVALTGTGYDPALPDIEVAPVLVDFGDVTPPASTEQSLTIRNVGGSPLRLGEVFRWGSGAVDLAADPSAAVLDAGDEIVVPLLYAPVHEAGDVAWLDVPSDDWDQPLVRVELRGNGGSDAAVPTAEISCPALVPSPGHALLDGRASYDDDGGVLSFEWYVRASPTTSSPILTPGTDGTAELWVDVAGTYVAGLQVTNESDLVSRPTTCAVEAQDADSVLVELTWDGAKADLDLHLLQDPLAELFEKPGDCTYCNPNPEWGDAGPDGDPWLAVDDRGGYGPEVIRVAATADGDYPVKVHYFDQHSDDDVQATVRIYGGGVGLFEETRAMSYEEVWDVGVLHWPSATFDPDDEANWVTSLRECY